MQKNIYILLFTLLLLFFLTTLVLKKKYMGADSGLEGFTSSLPSSSTGKTYIFYHVYCGPTTYPILQEQVYKIVYSGLYHRVDAIYCFLAGDEKIIQRCRHFLEKSGSKFKIAKVGIQDRTYERFTLEAIRDYVKPQDKFLYIHTKGVGKSDLESISDWRNNMEYFLYYHHKECLKLLETYDTVGLNYKDEPSPHYSGNFWWCRASYYLTLPSKIGPDYYDPEMYLMLEKPRYAVIYNTQLIENPNQNNNRHEYEEYGMKYYIDQKDPLLPIP